jgi:hypothetical protein
LAQPHIFYIGQKNGETMSEEPMTDRELAKGLSLLFRSNELHQMEEAISLIRQRDEQRDEELIEGIAKHFYTIHLSNLETRANWAGEVKYIRDCWLQDAETAIKQAREKKE